MGDAAEDELDRAEMYDDRSLVSRDPRASERERMADLAHSPVIVLNHIADPKYAPYCGRCSGLVRMKVVAPFYWEHSCGAVHDERHVLTAKQPPALETAVVPYDCIGCGEVSVPTQHTYCEECHQAHQRIAAEQG
jgi:hypothetical protein